MENSFWILNNESEDYSALDKSIDAEYLIVGAGLTGLHTAYLLSDISSNIVIVLIKAPPNVIILSFSKYTPNA